MARRDYTAHGIPLGVEPLAFQAGRISVLALRAAEWIGLEVDGGVLLDHHAHGKRIRENLMEALALHDRIMKHILDDQKDDLLRAVADSIAYP